MLKPSAGPRERLLARRAMDQPASDQAAARLHQNVMRHFETSGHQGLQRVSPMHRRFNRR
jgi:hypothetical protein